MKFNFEEYLILFEGEYCENEIIREIGIFYATVIQDNEKLSNRMWI
jgi:hypothetical protein